MNWSKLLGSAALAAVAIVSSAIFVVDQRQYAVVFQFGEVTRGIEDPGLKWKIPLIQNVRYFDRRILTIDTPEPERFITSEKQNVLVDHFVKWRIIDPRLYYVSVAGDEARARTRLLQTVNAGLREEFGRRTVSDVVSGERDAIMERMRVRADQDARQIGVQILDVRLKRVDLPTEVSGSVFRRMEAERTRVANDLRSQGAAIAEQIRADADRQRTVIVAEADREAEAIMGEGDARATSIYAAAFGKDPQFYAFLRSINAYRQSFNGGNDVMVLDPSSSFFRYLKDPLGGAESIELPPLPPGVELTPAPASTATEAATPAPVEERTPVPVAPTISGAESGSTSAPASSWSDVLPSPASETTAPAPGNTPAPSAPVTETPAAPAANEAPAEAPATPAPQ